MGPRTLLTARLHRAVAKAYFGYRVWARGDPHRTEHVTQTVREGLREIDDLTHEIQHYPVKPAAGQWNWIEDAEAALRYHQWITQGWPAQTRYLPNPYGGLAFPRR